MNTATIGMMSIYFIFLFGYYLALGKKNKQPIIGGFVALASFVIACMGQITFFMGAQGLIAAIVFGIISSELYVRFCNVEKFNLKLPDSVPPAVGKSFQVFLPAFFALACVAVLNLVVLMPAILIPSSHLYVTGMSYDTVSNGLLFDQTM
jgi:PTS system cellobiose-specific IIC component